METAKIAEKTYAITFEAYQITGGANGMIRWKSYIIDLNQNKRLELDDVFQLNDSSIEDIQHLIMDELHNSQQDVSRYIFDDMADEVLKDPDNWKWSISREGLAMYFDDYEIAAGAAGAIKVEVPLNKIKRYLDEDFAKKLEVKIPDKESAKKENENSEEAVLPLDLQGKYVALTFDGPHPEVTPRVLDTLKQHNTKATFFMLGIQAEYYPSIADQVDKAGHEIGNHTMNHQDLTTLGASEILKEAQQPNSIIEKATGEKLTLLRPPYGALNEDVKQIASDMSLPIIMWSVDSLDWKSRNAAAVNEVVMSNVAPGSIVLLRDIHSTTADALPQLLSSLKEQGYQMVTVCQLPEHMGATGPGTYYGKLK
ncbi:MAG: polysaccharide deacetylase family protein [Atopostipes suicloacalis]|nr:polysaccharide deacetylase family protein [Atopostipes suicloacalis]